MKSITSLDQRKSAGYAQLHAATTILFPMAVMLLISVLAIAAGSEPVAQDVSENMSAATREPRVGELHALVVGISNYRNAKIPSLEMSVKDARAFSDFLRTQDKLFSRIRLRVLLNEKATMVEIKKQLFHSLRKAEKNDTVVLFFSGHGSIAPDIPGEYFLLTYDSDPHFPEATAVNMSRMRFLQRLKSKRVVVIADTRHAGGFNITGSKSVQPALKNLLRDFRESEGRVVITSCRPDEISLDNPQAGNSIFTHYLIKALKGAADADRDGVVTLKEAYDFTYASTKAETKGGQHPQWEGRVEGALALSFLNSGIPSLTLVTRPALVDVSVKQEGGFRSVGRTGEDGRLVLRDVRLGRPLFVRLKRRGWRDLILGPYVLSQEELHKTLPPVELKPRTGFLALKTSAPGARIRIGSREAGVTTSDGMLIVDNVQVGVPLEVSLNKEGYRETTVNLTIPLSHEGKVYMSSPIDMNKLGKAAARPEQRPARRKKRPDSRAISAPAQGAGRPEKKDRVRTYAPDVRNLIDRAERGDPEAQFKLGLRFLRGEGVPRDHNQAAKWFRAALENRYSNAKERPDATPASKEPGKGGKKPKERVSRPRENVPRAGSADIPDGDWAKDQTKEFRKDDRDWERTGEWIDNDQGITPSMERPPMGIKP